MSNTVAFLLGVILVLFIAILVSVLSRSSASVAKYYQPVACNGVIGN